MRTFLIAIAGLAGVMALSAAVVMAQSRSSAEVRIAAMRHDDGRIEFALQQRKR